MKHRTVTKEEKRVHPIIKETDLRSITREPNRCFGLVILHLGWDDEGRDEKISWLRFGEAQIRTDQKPTGTSRLEAHLGDYACDPEHDTGYALRLPLIGLQLDGLAVHYSRTYFTAWVDPACGTGEGFHVPRPGYNPMKHPKATECNGKYDGKKNWCKWGEGKPHIIIPEGFYVPPFDPELYRAVAGKRLEIIVGARLKGEEDD